MNRKLTFAPGNTGTEHPATPFSGEVHRWLLGRVAPTPRIQLTSCFGACWGRPGILSNQIHTHTKKGKEAFLPGCCFRNAPPTHFGPQSNDGSGLMRSQLLLTPKSQGRGREKEPSRPSLAPSPRNRPRASDFPLHSPTKQSSPSSWKPLSTRQVLSLPHATFGEPDAVSAEQLDILFVEGYLKTTWSTFMIIGKQTV